MRYHNITKDDMLNGDGLRVVLWVAGCEHHCPNCQNPVTWDINGGLEFDEAAKKEIFDELEKNADKDEDPIAEEVINKEEVLKDFDDEEDDDFDEETDDEFDDDFGEDEFEDTDMEGDDF